MIVALRASIERDCGRLILLEKLNKSNSSIDEKEFNTWVEEYDLIINRSKTEYNEEQSYIDDEESESDEDVVELTDEDFITDDSSSEIVIPELAPYDCCKEYFV